MSSSLSDVEDDLSEVKMEARGVRAELVSVDAALDAGLPYRHFSPLELRQERQRLGQREERLEHKEILLLQHQQHLKNQKQHIAGECLFASLRLG